MLTAFCLVVTQAVASSRTRGLKDARKLGATASKWPNPAPSPEPRQRLLDPAASSLGDSVPQPWPLLPPAAVLAPPRCYFTSTECSG